MPDEHGNIRGIRVPRVPWHEDLKPEPSDEPTVIGAVFEAAPPDFNDVELTHDPYGIGNPD